MTTVVEILINADFHKARLLSDGSLFLSLCDKFNKRYSPKNAERIAEIVTFCRLPIPADEDSQEFADWEDKFCSFL